MVFRRCEIAFSGVRSQGSSSGGGSGSSDPIPPGALAPSTDATSAGANVGAGNGIDNRNAARMVVQDCYVHDIAGTGILVGGGAADSLVERTVVKDVAVMGILVGSFDTEIEYQDVAGNPARYESVRATVSPGRGRGSHVAHSAALRTRSGFDDARRSATTSCSTLAEPASASTRPAMLSLCIIRWLTSPSPCRLLS